MRFPLVTLYHFNVNLFALMIPIDLYIITFYNILHVIKTNFYHYNHKNKRRRSKIVEKIRFKNFLLTQIHQNCLSASNSANGTSECRQKSGARKRPIAEETESGNWGRKLRPGWSL